MKATLATFFMMMMHNPAVVKRAQDEIDLAVGPERLPTPEDRTALPYLDCILKELFRYVHSRKNGLTLNLIIWIISLG